MDGLQPPFNWALCLKGYVMKIIFITLALILYSIEAFSTSMFLDDNIRWGEKEKEYEIKAIKSAKSRADSILVVRALSWENPANSEIEEVNTVHLVEVLETIKGSHNIGERIKVKVLLEQDDLDYGWRGMKEPTYDMIARVEPFDGTFKYLLYLDNGVVLRHSRFIEWHKGITTEEEYFSLKK